ncbi:hypothetical protein JDV02_009253 [Purpureocillium takamizusanense]|uniref:IDI-2 n=1 Tax=Purpureocillium takamizusanense TaxID=2060973 RepID=A0A9Q8VE27_9HYPO|nr:uncharacterized protein JDV02_009253 [Purpureocillium takamizusanense]XP_047846917.1 uncharacterized protein JDV02_009253 [Purpureocillium takamizusanense]UNI23435.1 hypothetical protein JDV02_009253 [Purpureocillium takamizusanense]UNI23436.1 hypothetical protein JDV02_009253 [Purpureocillium takamizusanense]
MKLLNILLMTALQVSCGLATPVDAASEQCGALGVMEVDTSKIPDGVDRGDIRKCAEHPVAGSPNPLSKRDCWYGKSSGCSKGYCWKTCGGTGQWCWTAFNDGYGNWIGCQNDGQCNTNQACGIGNCKTCGCSC